MSYSADSVFAEELCLTARRLLQQVSALRHIRSDAAFACRVENREQVRQFLRSSVEERLQGEKAAYEQLIFEVLGVIPKDYPYIEGLVSLYTAQLGGYYDPKTKTVVMADWMPEPLQRLVAAHELVHLLQDSKFHLEPIVGLTISEFDQALARAALVEGDATIAAEAFQNAYAERSALTQTTTPENVVDDPPIFVPEILMELVHFPYEEGVRFVEYLKKQGGMQAVDAALTHPPNSSKEILHPQVYEERIRNGTPVQMSPVLVPKDVEYSDTLGEFFIQSLLRDTIATVTTRKEVAGEIVSDKVYVEKSARSELRVVWTSQWTTKESADIFANYLRIHLQQSRKIKLLGNNRNQVVVRDDTVTATLSRE